MNTDIIWQLLLQVILIALNAVFACAEIAVITMNDAKLAKLASEGNKKAIRLARLTSKPARFLATIQVAITLSGFLGSAFASQNFADVLVKLLKKIPNMPLSDDVLNSICVILITIILSYLTLVFGELVPKRVAMRKAEKIALGLSGIVSFISVAFSPIVGLLTASTNGVLRLMGIDPNQEDEEVTEENIRMMVDVGSEKGVIDSEEKQMIENVFEFDNIAIESLVTHRTDVVFLREEDGLDVWDETIREYAHSYYPICGETVDDVTGVLSAKEYFRLRNVETKEEVIEKAVKTPYFVPETLRADALFRQMKHTGNYFALVLDEYGGLFGVVTVKDILAEIVGDFDDEENECGNASEDSDIIKINDIVWRISGSAELKEVALTLGLKLPTDEYDTFGGYIFGVYGTVPEDGSTISVEADGMHIDVIGINEHRVESANVYLLETEEEDEEEAEEE